ncbi:MAG TPA: DUF1638 domain-containing protein [Methanomassiliicoccales archaeon]|nr:DUF1638 domain-containing protein [Methanomassiliicoccales archaeon]
MAYKGTLGLIGCPILEDEIAYVLTKDNDISSICFVDTEDCKNLVKKVKRLDPKKNLFFLEEGDIDSYTPENGGFSVLVWIKPSALHEDPDNLRDKIVDTMTKIDEKCDSILLFYGLCGNAFKNIDKISDRFTSPVTIMKDLKGQIVDDCIAVPLGGTEGYLSLLKKYPGVFYMTPAWAENWKDLIRKAEMFRGMGEASWDDLKFIFEMANYTKVLKIRTGLGDNQMQDEKTKEFAEIFNFEEHILEDGWCSLDVTKESYAKAKGFLSGESPES